MRSSALGRYGMQPTSTGSSIWSDTTRHHLSCCSPHCPQLPSNFLLFTSAASWASLALVTYGLARHGLAGAMPYSLPLLWAQLAALCVLVAAFVAVRSRLWAALLRLLAPGAPPLVRAAPSADAAAAPSPLMAPGSSGDGAGGNGRCRSESALGLGGKGGTARGQAGMEGPFKEAAAGWVAEGKHAATGGFGAVSPGGVLPELPQCGTAAAVAAAIAAEVRSRQRAGSESRWVSGRGEGQGGLGRRDCGGSVSQPLAWWRGGGTWQCRTRWGGLVRRLCTDAAAEVVAGGQGQEALQGRQVLSQQQRHAAPQHEQQQHGWGWVVRLLGGQAEAWGWGGGAGRRRAEAAAGAGGDQRCGSRHSGGGCGGDRDAGRLCQGSGPSEGVVGMSAGGAAGDLKAASFLSRGACTGAGTHLPGEVLQGREQQRPERPGSGGVGHMEHVPGRAHDVQGLAASFAFQDSGVMHEADRQQQQQQQQQQQARTAELVERARQFIRQNRNAPYRSDTAAAVVWVAVRLPGLQPQHVHGNGDMAAAWLAEQLGSRWVAIEPQALPCRDARHTARWAHADNLPRLPLMQRMPFCPFYLLTWYGFACTGGSFTLLNHYWCVRLHMQACACMGGPECSGGGATRRRCQLCRSQTLSPAGACRRGQTDCLGNGWEVGRQQAAPHATCADNGCHRMDECDGGRTYT